MWTRSSTADPETLVTFVDTSAWYALLIPGDRNHIRAIEWLTAYSGRLLRTDYVIDDTLTLLRSRGHGGTAIDWGDAVLGPISPAVIHYLTPTDITAAWDVFRRYADKDWSFTDCTSKVVMESQGIATAFGFDQHFRQF